VVIVRTDDGFEWDEEKNASNVRKHGIDFSDARRIFDGFVLTQVDDRMDYGEFRAISVGMIGQIVTLAVVHTDRAGRTRIISARKANRRERARYEETVRKAADA
jgi:uncharacterized DUF497 family protein